MTKEMQTKVENYARVHKFLLNQTKLDAIDWYLDNVWHEPSEKPEIRKSFLAIMTSGVALVLVLINEVDFPCKGLERWAYIEDLYYPSRKSKEE